MPPYITVTNPEIDFKSPMSEALWRKFRDNDEDLNARLQAAEGGPADPNNTVVTSRADAEGRPDYVTAGVGLSVNVDGSVTPVSMIIDGKLQTIPSLVNVPGLANDAVSFIFAEQGAGTAPTLGSVALVAGVSAPLYAYKAPSTPVVNDHWFDLAANRMKRFNGVAFEDRKRIFIAVAIAAGGAVTAVVTCANGITPLQRLELFGDGSNGTKSIPVGTVLENGLRQFTFFHLAPGAVYENSDPAPMTLQIYSQNPVIVRGTIDLRSHGTQRPTATGGPGNNGGRGGAGGGGAEASTGTGGSTKQDDEVTFLGGGAGGSGGGQDGQPGAPSNYLASLHEIDLNLRGAAGGAGSHPGRDGSDGGGGLVISAPEILVTGSIDLRGGTEGNGDQGGGGGGGGSLVTVSRSFKADAGIVDLAGGITAGSPRGGFGGAGSHSRVRV